MFTVVQFFEQQRLRVLAVPVSWVRDGFLMWPKLPSNEKIENLRTGGNEFHGATKKIPVIVSRKYKSLQAAEAAAEELLKQDISDIETKRKLLKHKKSKTVESRPLKNYNKIIENLASSKTHAPGSDCSIQQLQNPETSIAVRSQLIQLPPQDCASGSASSLSQETRSRQVMGHHTPEATYHSPLVKSDCTQHQQEALNSSKVFQPSSRQPKTPRPQAVAQSGFRKSNNPSDRLKSSVIGPSRQMQIREAEVLPSDEVSSAVLELPGNSQGIQPAFVTDENIIYVYHTPQGSDAIQPSGNTVDSVGEMKVLMESLKSEVAKMGTAVNSLRAEVINMKDGLTNFKQDVADTVRQVVDACLEENFPRFATMLTMEKKDQPVSGGKPVEEHKLINDEEDLNEFNKTLGNKQVFDDYVKYFTKIIPPITYYAKGDSACYLIVDCLFTRTFWNSFTWTGINRGNKSKRGFREFANVLQLLLAIVNVGDPTYTNIKLEEFCKNRLFRYSKARSCSKLLRKSTCRRTKKKNEGPLGDANRVDDDEPGDNSDPVDPNDGDEYDMDVTDPANDDERDTPVDNITSDSDRYQSDDELDGGIDMKAHVEVVIHSDE